VTDPAPRTETDASGPLFAVTGATGQQGGATARALLAAGARVRALVRNPDGAAAQALRSAGVQLVRADLDDPEGLPRALDGVDGVFAVTTFTGPQGTAGEVTHGRAIGDAAAAAGVAHVVYSSVGGAERRSGVPHFESKRRVEEHLHELSRRVGLRVTVIRPTFFMDNFTGFMAPQVADGTLVLRMPLPADVPLQLIASDDIGAVAAAALTDPDRVPTGSVEIAGDELTGEQIAAAYGEHAGLPAHYEPLLAETLDDPDARAMFAWFAHPPAYQADFAATRALVPDVHTLATWLAGRD
jgi:uncharacterized protein YbjT (DUF2867 family)